MFILPYIHFTISTEKTPEEVQELLQSVTGARKKWFMNSGVTAPAEDKDFIGKVGEADFEIVPRLRFVSRNDFRPVIEGRILAEGSSTVVDVQMRLQWFLYVAEVVFFGVGVLLALSALDILMKGDMERLEDLLMAVFWIVCDLTSRCWFYFPAEKARQKLEDLFGTVSVDV